MDVKLAYGDLTKRFAHFCASLRSFKSGSLLKKWLSA
jgi:hypothetical protein